MTFRTKVGAYYTDRPEDGERCRLLGALGLPTVTEIGTLANDAPGRLVIIDVDLSRTETVYAIRPVLAHLKEATRVFLIDTHNRVEAVHAHTLGAAQVIDRSVTAADLEALMAQFLAPPTLDGLVKVLSQAMDDLFDGFRNKQQLEMVAFDRSVDEVLSNSGVNFDEWISSIRRHHEGTYQHCLLVTACTVSFATHLRLGRDDIRHVTSAAMLHDVGKVNISAAILEKPGKLTSQEMAIIQKHPKWGFDYLKNYSQISPSVLRGVRDHHEFLDGTGYPSGLSGDQISRLTRILTICDIYAALREERSYKPPMSKRNATMILKQMAAVGKLDGHLVEAFAQLI